MLHLDENKIGDQGAQYLGNALQINKVRQFLHTSITYVSCSLNADTQNAESCQEPNRCRRSAILG